MDLSITTRIWLTLFLDRHSQWRERVIVVVPMFTATGTAVGSVAQPSVPAYPAPPQRLIDWTTHDDAQHHRQENEPSVHSEAVCIRRSSE